MKKAIALVHSEIKDSLTPNRQERTLLLIGIFTFIFMLLLTSVSHAATACSIEAAPQYGETIVANCTSNITSGTCFAQGLQRCAVMRPVIVSVWNKKTGPGIQN